VDQSDVYLINGSAFSDLAKVACKLTEKAYKQKLNVCLVTKQDYEAQALDDALWAFDELSFIPHHVLSKANKDETNINCVLIISEEQLDDHKPLNGKHDVLIYLQTKLLEPEPSAQRRLVLVPNDEASLSQARSLFKELKKRGEEVNTHDMRR
jgi:DNA polymerase III subunit chi